MALRSAGTRGTMRGAALMGLADNAQAWPPRSSCRTASRPWTRGLISLAYCRYA